MPTNVILPALGMAQDTGKILEWLKAEGDEVREGDAIATIETDKAAVDIEAPANGVLSGIRYAAQSEVPVGQVIALILSAEEVATGGQPQSVGNGMASAAAAASPASAPSVPSGGMVAHQVASVPASTPMHAGAASLASNGTSHGTNNGTNNGASNGRVLASPKARRLAVAADIDLRALHGTGPGGAVLTADLPRVAQEGAPAAVIAPVSAPAVSTPTGTGVSTLWRVMAERTTSAWATTPHFFLTREINASALKQRHHRRYAAQNPREVETTVTDLLVEAVAQALAQHPRLRAQWRENTIVPSDEINVGLAVAVENGLVVPVIHHADELNVAGIARRRRDLISRAQAGRLRPQDLDGGVFTISNLGMYGIDAFNAILNGGQAAILAVGRIADRVVPVNGQPGIQPMMTLTLSCDHRVVDGARGAQFLATLADLLERGE